MNSIISNIKARRSVRKYKPKKISDKLVKKIIDAGRFAPSSHNSQPWRFIVLTNKKKIKTFSDYLKAWFRRRIWLGKLIGLFHRGIGKEIETAKKRALSEKDVFLYSAPLVVVICARPGRFHKVDCGCAAQNMMLAANSLGIGSCWIGFADMVLRSPTAKNLRGFLRVPKGTEVVGTIVFGYPEAKPGAAAPRKEAADIVKWFK